mmetsp:Transcript_31383/g.66787  ORF Transcript_31383/g.66787 Transcript_31383/m.66787 type:complete len:224 (+) Transcript_31383:2242-2913(+)
MPIEAQVPQLRLMSLHSCFFRGDVMSHTQAFCRSGLTDMSTFFTNRFRNAFPATWLWLSGKMSGTSPSTLMLTTMPQMQTMVSKVKNRSTCNFRVNIHLLHLPAKKRTRMERLVAPSRLPDGLVRGTSLPFPSGLHGTTELLIACLSAALFIFANCMFSRATSIRGYMKNCRRNAPTTQRPMKSPNSRSGINTLPRFTRKLLAEQSVVVAHEAPELPHSQYKR